MAALVAVMLMLGFGALVIESFVPADDSDPFVAAMKREGCLWEPGWWHRTVLALIVVAYAAIFHCAWKRQAGPPRDHVCPAYRAEFLRYGVSLIGPRVGENPSAGMSMNRLGAPPGIC
jgi:hypothetical protein